MEIKNALIVGAGHGIGLGLVQSLLEQFPNSQIFATYRDEKRASELLKTSAHSKCIDPSVEEDLLEYFKTLPELDLVICTIGALQKPEKSLRDISIEQLSEAFKVNAAIPMLICKHAKPRLNKTSENYLIFLSAMVGSIGDNQVGGWYGYRAAKSALNQLIKTASIEYSRAGYKTKLGVIHPGTTETELSKGFLGNVKHRVWTPIESAQNILKVIGDLKSTGEFKNWDGTTIPW